MPKLVNIYKSLLICLVLLTSTIIQSAFACTRVLYTGENNIVITGRTMDWFEDPQSNLWIFPRGMVRENKDKINYKKWTSKYGSLVADIYSLGTVDGLNEKGLAVNLLYLIESDYGNSLNIPKISIGAWAQYVLDNFATVSEAILELQEKPMQIIAPMLPNGIPANAHFAISDPTGDSAVFEWVDGKLVIHHGKEHKVMTNSPVYDKQLAINEYWEQISGFESLPGTSTAADRFARASFYNSHIPKTANEEEGVAIVMSIMRNVSVPRGIVKEGTPNVSTTHWISLIDQKNKVFFFESTSSPSTFWVTLSNLNLEKGAPVKKLNLQDQENIISGDASGMFEEAKAFKFLSAE